MLFKKIQAILTAAKIQLSRILPPLGELDEFNSFAVLKPATAVLLFVPADRDKHRDPYRVRNKREDQDTRKERRNVDTDHGMPAP